MKKVFLILFVLLFICTPTYARDNDGSDDNNISKKRLLLVPYPFFNESIGFGGGVAAIAEGYGQRQMTTVGSVLASSNGTYYGFLLIRNYQVPFAKRLFLEPEIFFGKFGAIQTYLNGNPAFPNEDSGNNNSHKDNFTENEGKDNSLELTMKYLLPIGYGKSHILQDIRLDDGILVSEGVGDRQWNPFRSGRTFIEFAPFFRKQKLEDSNKTVQKTAGFEAGITYNNTDFEGNPSTGTMQKVFFIRDWGGADSSAPWSVVGADFTKYISLGATDRARQRVLALNFWTIDCLTWDSSHTNSNGVEVFHRSPSYKGANLGGLYRLRGYPATRFHDQAAIYHGA